MNQIKIHIPFLIAALFLLTIKPLSAHYGPRGLLGGSLRLGIQHNGSVYLGSADAGVFESTNAQLTGWRLRAVGLKSGKVTALAHSGAELYAAVADSGIYIFNGAQGTDLYWNQRNNGLGSLNISSLMAVDANTLFAGTSGDGLYKTTDKGLNWTAVNSAALNGQDITALTMGGGRLFALVSNGGVFKSDDNGATWTGLNDANTLNKASSEYFSYNVTTNQLLVSNIDGLFVLASANTTNAPAYVAASTGLGAVSVRSLTNNGTSWYLASHSGVFATPAASINWVAANTGLTTPEVEVVVAVDDTLVAGTYKKGVFKTNAASINWVAVNTGMTNINTNSIACKGDSLVVTATEYGVTVSTNIGNNPVISNNGLTDSLNVNDVEIGENLLFAATANLGVFVSSDLGQSWAQQNNGLTNLNIKRVIYGNGRKYAIDGAGALFESNLLGTSWTQITTGLPTNAAATSLAFFGNMQALGTYGNGVYVKHRDSTSWVAFNTGLSNMDVTSVTYSADKLYAGTDGAGVFVSSANAAGWTMTSPVSIPHFSIVPIDASQIQYMTTIREYVVATFKGGVAATTDGGATWVEAGNQFNLPSYTNIKKATYVTSRIFVTTETNNAQSNAAAELDFTDSLLVVRETIVNAPISASESYHSITSNMKWKLSSSANWVTMSVDSGLWNGNIRLDIAPNPGGPRGATVTVTADTMVRTITINQDGNVGVAEVAKGATSVRLYPNPSNGTFTLDLNGLNAQLILVQDVTGRRIASIAANGKSTIVVSEKLTPGIYLVQVHSDEGVVVKRITVE